MAITEQPTAEMPSPAGDKIGAAHSTKIQTLTTLTMWLERRLLRAFRKEYEHKKIAFILDDAARHRGIVDGWKSLVKTTEAANAALLRDLGAETITAQHHVLRKDFVVAEGGAQFARAPRPPSLHGKQKQKRAAR